MTTVRHFNGETELRDVHYEGRKLVGQPVDYTPTWDRAASRWVRLYVNVERSVTFKSNPSRHDCDARCFNATGRTMNCECSCGGKNHGRGAFNCEAVAA